MADRRVGLPQTASDRLDSWKDIAAFFGRDVRTVRRWEADRGLPVRRVPGHSRGRVFAYVADLKAWLDTASADSDVADGPAVEVSAFDGVDVGNAGHAGSAGDTGLVDPAVAQAPLADPPPQPSPVHDQTVLALPILVPTLRPAVPSSGLVPIAATEMSASRRWLHWPRWGLAAAMVALLVAGVLLVGSRRTTAASPHVATAQAQDLYLRGRYALSLRTEASLNDAAALFTRAVETDPRYAAAYAGLADSHILLRQFGNVPDMEAFAKALAADERALALDPNSVEALRTHAFLLNFWMWDFPAAEREFKRAIALDPLDVQSHHWYATSLYSAGRFRDALAEIDTTRRLQPDAVPVLANHALLRAALDAPGALEELQQLEQTNPGVPTVHRFLGLVHFRLGQPQAAIAEMRQTAVLHGDTDAVAVIDRAIAALAEGSERRMLQTMGQGLGRMADRYAIEPLKPAYYYALLGDPERTLHYLTLAFDRHEADFVETATNPVFAFLHGTPAFDALQRRRGAATPTAASATVGGVKPFQ